MFEEINLEKDLELNSKYYYFCVQLLFLLEIYFKFFYYSENMITIEISVGGGNTYSGSKV
jgi:hypothetical protein